MHPPPGPPVLTPELLAQIEERKKAALELRARKRQLADAQQDHQTQTQVKKEFEPSENAATQATATSAIPNSPRPVEENRPSEAKRRRRNGSSKLSNVDLELSNEQKHVVDNVLSGTNVFITGSAGTGKSFLLRKLIEILKSRGLGESLAITAPTGIAACHLNGCTIHSFAGVGLGTESKEKLADKVMSSRRSKLRWLNTKCLIVDEVSMLDGKLFEKLEFIARRVTGKPQAFGGIQLILCGDFFQLPPVSNQKTFAFETEAWKSCVQVSVELTKVFRQADASFVNMLNEVRYGNASASTVQRLQGCTRNVLDCSDGINTTKLFCLKNCVETENNQKLQELSGEAHTFYAEDKGQNPYLQQIQTACQATAELRLKVGAQVMLLHNLNVQASLVNGSRGVVEDFRVVNSVIVPLVKFINGQSVLVHTHEWTVEISGEVLASRTQVPLALAWSMTVHKSQGMTIDRLEVSLRNVFECGQAYVALSRATSLESLRLLDFNPKSIFANDRVKKFYTELTATSSAQLQGPVSTLSPFPARDFRGLQSTPQNSLVTSMPQDLVGHASPVAVDKANPSKVPHSKPVALFDAMPPSDLMYIDLED